MKKLLFDDWHQWKVCMWAGICKASWGLWRIISCLLFGLLSVFWWLCKQICAFRKREFVASFVIVVVILFLVFGWITTFVKERSMRVTAEHERDSVAYVLQQKMEIYELHKETVITGDTIKAW